MLRLVSAWVRSSAASGRFRPREDVHKAKVLCVLGEHWREHATDNVAELGVLYGKAEAGTRVEICAKQEPKSRRRRTCSEPPALTSANYQIRRSSKTACDCPDWAIEARCAGGLGHPRNSMLAKQA